MPFVKPALLIAVIGGGLAACGDTTGKQALYGGGAGAAVAAATQNNPVTGAVIGAGANIAACEFGNQPCE
ncbi:hypothetical protein [Chachezhania antarctica]|uniref:hypothetical protein n=1 Tax=Chachezhania antarctica TaxID=2340860 RepID=UPI000EABC3CD|nr:hypothetical protein [Chachezhania antarctica]|tara:strand:+ start:1652 stop:1861 length:210 start_codon:yes stop_codon:yes gene_type:complete